MSGRWTKAATLGLLLVTLAGCSPTAAPQKKGTAAEPLRNATSQVTRGTDRMIRGATGRGSGGMGNWFNNLWGTNRTTGKGTSTRMGVGMTRTYPTPVTGRVGTKTGTTGAGFGAATKRMGKSLGTGGIVPKTARMGASSRTGTKGNTGMSGVVRGMTGASSTKKGVKSMFGAASTTGVTPLRVVGFFTEDASKTGLTALGRDPKALSDLSPWWYTLNADGSIKDTSTPATRAWVSQHQVPLVPLVTNGGQYKVLEDNTAMHTAIQNLTTLVSKNNFSGLNVDFQGLPFQTRTGLNAFVDELSHNLHAIKKTVAVDIIPTQAQTGAHGAYDEVTLSHYADQLVLMTYDRHDDSSKPGPVSPHDWVVSAVQHTLQSGVPANKIVLGVNDYGYDWNTATGKAVTIPQKVATTFPSSEKSYDSTTKEVKVTYTKNGQSHIVYYGGREALKDKVAIAKQYKLYGIAIWRVGYEDAAYWQTLVQVNGDAASLQSQAGATSSSVPSAAYGHRVDGTKPMAHRPIGTKSGRTSGAHAKKGVKKGNMMKSGKHGGTARSQSGKQRGAK